MAATSVGRLNYSLEAGTDREFSFGHKVHTTVSQGVNDGSVISFRVPPDKYRFTDLNKTLLEIKFRITKSDLTDLTENGDEDNPKDEVFLGSGGIHSMFSVVELYLNDVLVSNMNAYPFTSSLCRYLGTSRDIREQVWDQLDGTTESYTLSCSDYRQAGAIYSTLRIKESYKVQTYRGRVFVDFLNSVRQLLPPGVAIRLDMRRGPEHLALGSSKKVTGTDKKTIVDKESGKYRIHIETATLILDRLQLTPEVTARSLSMLQSGGVHMVYNSLETRATIIDKGEIYFSWLDFNIEKADAPNRMYFALVQQSTYYGNLHRCSTWFENANLSSLQLKLDGKPLLLEPIKLSFSNGPNDITKESTGPISQDNCDGKMGYLSLCEIFNQISDPLAPFRLGYKEFLRGGTILAVELSSCGQRAGSSGSFDLELTFDNGGCSSKMVLLYIAEKSNTVCLQP